MPRECRKARTVGVPAMLLIALTAGCGKPAIVEPPRPVTITIDVTASASVNPDGDGRPSPVVVRVYQLADDAAFSKADLNSLWSGEVQVLAASLVSRQEFMLAPGGRAQGSTKLAAATRHIAVAAAFRGFRDANWRVVQAVPQPVEPGPDLILNVALDAKSVSARLVSATNPGAEK